jgi:hypothetical protein
MLLESAKSGRADAPGPMEVLTMPYVTCPSCGERGKIPPTLVGARIKCKQCGVSFQVAPPAANPAARVTAGLTSNLARPDVPVRGGIEVEGLDASSWTLSTEAETVLKAEATAEPTESSPGFGPAGEPMEGTREYKVLTPKDKYFDGKFDLARLEEALNHLGRQGWIVKSMSTPHVKGFTGALEETIVVLLER